MELDLQVEESKNEILVVVQGMCPDEKAPGSKHPKTAKSRRQPKQTRASKPHNSAHVNNLRQQRFLSQTLTLSC